MSYTPLQVFSSYTLLKSTLSIKAVIRQAKELGYSSLALTDKNVMYGAVEFYKEAIKNDIKPLIGLTVDIEDEEASIESLELVLLARNNKGYQSLMSLSTDIMLNKKKITLNSLRKITKDIIVVLPFHSLELLDALVNDTSRLEGLFQTVADCLTHFYVSTLWRNETEPQLMQLKKTLNKLEIPLIVSEPISLSLIHI